MGWLVMGSIGAVFAGLFFGLRDLFPYLAAKRSGVIVRKGARGVRVRRDENPEGFDTLLTNRGKGAVLGFGLTAAGLLVLSLLALALTGTAVGPLRLLVFAIFIGFAAFAAICLIRGFATGRMFAFWSLLLYGDANRKQNPTWFWIYTALNILTLLVSASTLLHAFA